MTTRTAPIDAPARFNQQVRVRILSVDAVDAEGQGPGEISSPGVAITMRLDNESTAPISLATVNVNVTDGTGAPVAQVSGPPSDPFAGTLAPGGSATGVFVFTVPPDHRDHAAVSVNYTAGAPVVLFRGNLT